MITAAFLHEPTPAAMGAGDRFEFGVADWLTGPAHHVSQESTFDLDLATEQFEAPQARLTQTGAQLFDRERRLADLEAQLSPGAAEVERLRAEARREHEVHERAMAEAVARHTAHEKRWLTDLDAERALGNALKTELAQVERTIRRQQGQGAAALATAWAMAQADALRAELAEASQREATRITTADAAPQEQHAHVPHERLGSRNAPKRAHGAESRPIAATQRVRTEKRAPGVNE